MRAGEEMSCCEREKKAGFWISVFLRGRGGLFTLKSLFYTDRVPFCFFPLRKWDWSTTTPIMQETTAPTWPSHIVVGPPYFQSFNLEMRGQCMWTNLLKALSILEIVVASPFICEVSFISQGSHM